MSFQRRSQSIVFFTETLIRIEADGTKINRLICMLFGSLENVLH